MGIYVLLRSYLSAMVHCNLEVHWTLLKLMWVNLISPCLPSLMYHERMKIGENESAWLWLLKFATRSEESKLFIKLKISICLSPTNLPVHKLYISLLVPGSPKQIYLKKCDIRYKTIVTFLLMQWHQQKKSRCSSMHLLLLAALPQRWKNHKKHWSPSTHTHTLLSCVLCLTHHVIFLCF